MKAFLKSFGLVAFLIGIILVLIGLFLLHYIVGILALGVFLVVWGVICHGEGKKPGTKDGEARVR